MSSKRSPLAPAVLVVDDEPSMRKMVEIMLKSQGCSVSDSSSAEEAMGRLEAGERFALVLTDLKMKQQSGLDLLREVKRLDPECQVILMTAFATAQTALEALREGAYDYLIKPFKVEHARGVVGRALEKHALLRENLVLKQALKDRQEASGGLGRIVGSSEAMHRVFRLIEQVAPTPTTVLVTGESGTGKELVAQALHDLSEVSQGPFVPLNCGAIPKDLLESELFGHTKGAFTGAVTEKKGIFESAEGGTVFLDEIGELPMATQVNFLRVLQEKQVRPVGQATERRIDCRIVAATNRNLKEEIAAGRFREDLFYRLNVIPIELPPLRKREGDVRLLLEHYIERYAKRARSAVRGVQAEALRVLLDYDYPGNVRELQNIVERAVTLERSDLIGLDVLPFHLQDQPLERVTEEMEIPEEGIDLEAMVERLERTMILKALDRSGGVRKHAAELLGITFRALRYRLEKYGIDPDEP